MKNHSSPGALTLADAFEQFLENSSLTQRTRKGYAEELASLLTQLGQAPVTALTTSVAQDFLARQELLAPKTYNRRLTILRGFTRWLHDQGWLADDILAGAKWKPEGKRTAQELDIQALESVLRRIEDPRDRALFWIMYDGGLRPHEVLAININDISQSEHSVIIHGEGDRPRGVFFSYAVWTLLDTYLEARGNPTSGPLFVTHRKARSPEHADLDADGHARLSYNQLLTLWKGYTPDWDLHQLRRTAISTRAPQAKRALDIEGISEPSLRVDIINALYDTCTRTIMTNPVAAPHAHLLRGQVLAAYGNHEAAAADFQAAIASQDSKVVFAAAKELITLERQPDWRTMRMELVHEIHERAIRDFSRGEKISYTRTFNVFCQSVPDPLQVSANDIEAYVREHPRRDLIIPVLDVFYTAAETEGFPNPMPQFKRHLEEPTVIEPPPLLPNWTELHREARDIWLWGNPPPPDPEPPAMPTPTAQTAYDRIWGNPPPPDPEPPAMPTPNTQTAYDFFWGNPPLPRVEPPTTPTTNAQTTPTPTSTNDPVEQTSVSPPAYPHSLFHQPPVPIPSYPPYPERAIEKTEQATEEPTTESVTPQGGNKDLT